jgi:hypothetical protein
MNPFNFKTNSDNVFFRALLVAFLNSLKDRIRYDVIVSESETRQFTLDFYYSIVGDGRFIQDNFINSDNCRFDFADGNYDPIPRGVVNIAGITMPEDSLTNNYVRIEYQKLVEGQMKTYSANAIIVPLRVEFQIGIIVDIMLDYFRILQVAFSEFFKTIPFSFRYETIRIPARAMIPAPLPGEKTFTYSYSDDQRIRMNFSIEVETYLPVIDHTTEFFKGNSMQTFASSQEVLKARAQAKSVNPRASDSSSNTPGEMTLVFDSYFDENLILPGQYLTLTNAENSSKEFKVIVSGPSQKSGNTITVPIADSDDFDVAYPRITEYSVQIITDSTNPNDQFQVFNYLESDMEIDTGGILFNVDVPGAGENANTYELVNTITISGTDFNQNDLTKWLKSVYITEQKFSKFITISNKTKGGFVTFKIIDATNTVLSNGNVDYSTFTVEYIGGQGLFELNDLCVIKYGSDDDVHLKILDFWTNIPLPDGLDVNLRLFKTVDSSQLNRNK